MPKMASVCAEVEPGTLGEIPLPHRSKNRHNRTACAFPYLQVHLAFHHFTELRSSGLDWRSLSLTILTNFTT